MDRFASTFDCEGLGTLKSFGDLKYYYEFNVSRADELFGEIIAELKKQKLYERSIIIVTSDHAEGFFEHGLLNHANSLNEELLRIPLMIHGPGYRTGKSASLVCSVDLVPTLLDQVGIKPADRLDGTSLVPLLKGEEPKERYCLAMGVHKGKQAISIQSLKWKLIVSSLQNEIELYNLATDPAERTNVAQLNPAIVNTLFSELGRISETK
ncbi:unnamed protein product [Sphagnum jensenii]